MADVTPVTPIAEVPASAKKLPKAKKEKKATSEPRAKATHPTTAIMVNHAIEHLKERGGSSLQAIKKYISATYKVDAEKVSPFIKKYLKSSVTSGVLVQTKGKGASGSFKLATSAVTKTVKKVKKPAIVKTEKPKTETPTVVKKTPAKKVAKPKKSSAKKLAAKPKSPSKAKKVAKVPTRKPKSPKPKSVKPKAVAAKSPKRTVPKRK